MDMIENLISEIGGQFGTSLQYQEHEIDLSSIRRVTFHDIVSEYCDVDVNTIPEEELVRLFENEVERNLINPTMVYNYPASISPLALPSSGDPSIAERFEIFIAGMEIGNAYSELNDVAQHIENLGDSDQDFIEALSYGMPPATGIGLGIDRIVMLLTNRVIRDVIYFPAMRS